jgi:AcrR family transcriptional regulator
MSLTKDVVAGGDRRHDAVLEAAAAVFSVQGLGATLAEIAQEAKVGVASVYRRFASKDDLIVALYAPRLAGAADAARASLDDPDPWHGFTTYFHDTLRQLVTDRGFRELTVGAYAGTVGWSRGTPPHRILELVQATEQAMFPFHVELVRRAQAAGALRADFEPSDMLVLTMAVLSAAEFAGAAFPDLTRRVATIVLDGLQPTRDFTTELAVPAVSDEALARARETQTAESAVPSE